MRATASTTALGRAHGGGAPCARCGSGSLAAPSSAAAASAAGAAAGSASAAGRRRLLAPCRVGVDPSSIQDLIVGGAVSAAVGAALVGGTLKDAEACSLCQTTGGARCFACEGTGKREPDASSSSSSRGPNNGPGLGGREDYDREGGGAPRPPPQTLEELVAGRRRPRNPRACRVCGGTGMVLCSQCKGSGYK